MSIGFGYPPRDIVVAEAEKRLLVYDRLQELKRELKGDIDQLLHEAEVGERRYAADKRCRAEAFNDVLRRLP